MSHPITPDLLYFPQSIEKRMLREVLSKTASMTIVELIDQVAATFTSSLTPESAKNFNGRLERGLDLAKNGAVSPSTEPGHPRRFKVRSSDGTKNYIVDLDNRSCECPDNLKGHTCKHRIAAYYFEQAKQLEQQAGQPYQPQPKKRLPTITPTCSVQPPSGVKFKPTCSIPPTKAEFILAEKRSAAPEKKPLPDISPRTVEEIMAELGFEQAAPGINVQHFQLGTLHRRYLHGIDLDDRPYVVKIINVTKEKVTPHPSSPQIEKWCLWVSGLPEGLPNGILFGSQGEEELSVIFGRVYLDKLIGKVLVIYPKITIVAGQNKVCIRFRGA